MAEKKPVKITETVLRDAHQSLIATRMTTEQMLPIIDKMDIILLSAGVVLHSMHVSDSLRKIHGRDLEN
jgi:pyruvate carboxylase